MATCFRPGMTHKQYFSAIDKAFNIKNFINDGFVKVCNVRQTGSKLKPLWEYTNIRKDVMFSEHRSWVYFIVLDTRIVKVGETGQPLGIDVGGQPGKSSKSRLGRYRSGDGTDHNIRAELRPHLAAGQTVSFWVRECQTIVQEEIVNGIPREIENTLHKNLEQHYLQHFKDYTNRLPDLNKSTK